MSKKGEARRYCCCITNIEAAKVLGIIGVVLYLTDIVLEAIGVSTTHKNLHTLIVGLLVNICLVIGTFKLNKHSKTFVMVWIILVMIADILHIIDIVRYAIKGDIVASVITAMFLGFMGWLHFVVHGAYEEIKRMNLENPSSKSTSAPNNV